MITKERLEELIEQRATIWTVNKSGNINSVKTNKTCEIQRQYLMKEGQIYSYIEQTFETEEDAKWFAEFGCIERTQRLVLPTWEEVSRDLQNVPAGTYTIKEFDDVSLEYIKYRNGNYAVIGVYKYDYRLELDATKENYIKACRKAKELFLGEKK